MKREKLIDWLAEPFIYALAVAVRHITVRNVNTNSIILELHKYEESQSIYILILNNFSLTYRLD